MGNAETKQTNLGLRIIKLEPESPARLVILVYAQLRN